MRDGVSASRVAVAAGPWPTVVAFLQARMPMVPDWPQRLQQGEVLDAQGLPLHPQAPAQPGAVLWYWRKPPAEARVPFEVDLLFQDEHLVVVDKPHFMSVTPGGQHLHETVLVRLKKRLDISTLVPMHRLDRETAGVMAFVVQPGARNAYQGLLREQRVYKVYEAVAPWRADLALPRTYSSRLASQDGDAFMQMLTLPGEPNAHTRIEVIRRWITTGTGDAGLAHSLAQPRAHVGTQSGPQSEPQHHEQPQAQSFAHYRLTPLTGRKHQLRVHLCALGVPIVGDRIYPRLWPQPAAGTPPDYRQPLQLLARELAFTDPVTGQPRSFFSRRQLQCVPVPTGFGAPAAAG